MMRRIVIALLLAVCLTLAFAVPALAEGPSDFGATVAKTALTTPDKVADYAVDYHPTGAP